MGFAHKKLIQLQGVKCETVTTTIKCYHHISYSFTIDYVEKLDFKNGDNRISGGDAG